MTITEFINSAPAERQATLTALHEAILANDPTVTPVIKPMMGKEMILYEQRSYMKYGLASTKNYMSLHCLPMYGSPVLFNEFRAMLPDANFQKGCINFTMPAQMPLDTIRQLFVQCSAIDLVKMREEYLKQKKQKGKTKT